ncbi:MAG: ccdA [Deltaproteobacteria bacterium]|jgi:cytochrome c-type biogenesis protein|nr:ccdA [Deltaproteobacteria bacterium]MBP1718297.1 ccdA [Deltaproteobacteria bacterium]
MSGGQDLSLFIAFAAGLLSFLSPCVLPLVPSYVVFITGLSFEELTHEHSKQKLRRIILSHSLLFILGFSVLFTALGASASLLGQFLSEYRDIIRIIGGVLIILFGLFISGIFSLSFLQQEKKFHLQHKPIGYIGTFFVGVTFAAGWTPCVGPILSSILLYASTAENMLSGVFLLLAYSLGLGIPFFACSLALNTFLATFQKARRYIGLFTKIGGVLLVLVGVLLLTNSFEVLNDLLSRWLPS